MQPNHWKDRKVFVTGATGLLGSWLIKELLSYGAYVVALVRDNDPQAELLRSGDFQKVHIINGQLEDFWTLERAVNQHEIETVFHLGAQAIVGTAYRFPLATFETNIRGTYNLLEACRIHKNLVKQVIVASSDKAYGVSENLPYIEEAPLKGRFPYDVSKSCTDLIAQSYAHSFSLPVVVIRCGNIYGGGDLNWSRIIPGTIRSFFLKERPVIRSDGKFIRDYVYVKDVCRFYLQVAQHLEIKHWIGEAFNYSLQKPLSVLQLVDKIAQLMHCQHLKPNILNNQKGEIHSQSLSSAKIRKLISIKGELSLEKGLIETIKWYKEFLRK